MGCDVGRQRNLQRCWGLQQSCLLGQPVPFRTPCPWQQGQTGTLISPGISCKGTPSDSCQVRIAVLDTRSVTSAKRLWHKSCSRHLPLLEPTAKRQPQARVRCSVAACHMAHCDLKLNSNMLPQHVIRLIMTSGSCQSACCSMSCGSSPP